MEWSVRFHAIVLLHTSVVVAINASSHNRMSSTIDGIQDSVIILTVLKNQFDDGVVTATASQREEYNNR